MADHEPPQLTSTTAPGKVFASRQELAEHYKSDWHKYNCKRRQAGLPVLAETEFQARWQAAQEARQGEQRKTKKKDHLKHKNKKTLNSGGVTVKDPTAAYNAMQQEQQQQQQSESIESQPEDTPKNELPSSDLPTMTSSPMDTNDTVDDQDIDEEDEMMMIEIDPLQSLFDDHVSTSIRENVQRMHQKYGFFIPDQEHLSDMEGLVGYCHEKIHIGKLCLYCQRYFHNGKSCIQHMIDTGHCKLAYERNVDLEDLSVFYDFEAVNAEFLGRKPSNDDNEQEQKEDEKEEMEVDTEENGEDGQNDGDWEDVSDEDMDENDEEDLYVGYEEQILNMGFDVTPLGELIFPDGRIVGHRSLRRYYKQRARSSRSDNVAVVAARSAAHERLYRGRVYSLDPQLSRNQKKDASSLAITSPLAAHPLSAATAGRSGKGLLVPINNSTGGVSQSFSQVSIYRYRAAVRKQRRGRDVGQRRLNKTRQNINRMDKKANNLMNGVIVPKAPR